MIDTNKIISSYKTDVFLKEIKENNLHSKDYVKNIFKTALEGVDDVTNTIHRFVKN